MTSFNQTTRHWLMRLKNRIFILLPDSVSYLRYVWHFRILGIHCTSFLSESPINIKTYTLKNNITPLKKKKKSVD